VLQRALQEARRLFEQGEQSSQAILGNSRSVIASAPLARIDYLEVVDAGTLEPVAEAGLDSVIVVAAFFGKTRLIDNLRLR
jgi:pantoate--beta-alanine ligase